MIKVRISSAGHCRRQVGYQTFGYRPTNKQPVKWQNLALMGGLAEQIMVKRLREDGWEVANALDDQETVSVVTDDAAVRFVGHPDGNVRDASSPDWWNLEMKCLSGYRADSIEKDGIEEAVPEYADQMTMYMRAKGQAQSLFVVMNRYTGEIRYYPYYLSLDRFEKVRDRWLEVAPVMGSWYLPEPDYDGTGFQCNVCLYREVCPAYRIANGMDSNGGFLP